MTVEEMLSRMSSRELSSWMVYDEHVEPIGDLRADLRAGGISATIANAFRDESKRREPYTPDDFRLHFGEGEPEDPSADHVTKMRALAALTKGKKRKGA